MSTRLQNVMVELGSTTEVMDLLIDEHGLTVGPYGRVEWKGVEVATEAGPAWCTIRVVTATGTRALFFVPGDTFSGAFSPQSFAHWLETQAAQAGATVDSGASVLA
jgi:hypothetical protein